MTHPKRIAAVAATAIALAAAGCSRGPEPSTVHLLGPAVAEAAVPPRASPAPAPAPSPAATAPSSDDAPSPAEIAEFERPVRK